MSDGLIERLEAKLAETKAELNTLKWMDLLQEIGAMVVDHQTEIIAGLSALKTLRGIEGAKRILIEWDEANNRWRVNTYRSEGWFFGDTLSLAVEAAVGADEIGGK